MNKHVWQNKETGQLIISILGKCHEKLLRKYFVYIGVAK